MNMIIKKPADSKTSVQFFLLDFSDIWNKKKKQYTI